MCVCVLCVCVCVCVCARVCECACVRALGPNPLHLCSASVADFFFAKFYKKCSLCQSYLCVCVCVCVCVCEHVFSTLHLCSSTRPSFLCGNFQIYSGFIDFFLTNKKKKKYFFAFPIHFQLGSY